MNLNNLSMNYKILLGISSITILTLIYQYVKNLFNPNKRLLEGQTTVEVGAPGWIDDAERIAHRYGTANSKNKDERQLDRSAELMISDLTDTHDKMIKLLEGIYDELGEFNHIYQERMFENLIPTQMRKTILHLSSIDHINESTGAYMFDLATNENSGLRQFNNIINLKLLGIQIPYIPHNIYAGNNNNNKLQFESSSEITIPEGKYDITRLTSKISSQFSQTIKFTFDQITYLVSIKNSTGSPIKIKASIYPLFKRLGFYIDVTIANGATYTSGNLPDISVHYIDIISPDIHPRGSTLTNNHSSILKRIPLTGQMGDLIYYEANYSDYISQEFYFPDISASLSQFNIILKRQDDSIYDLKKLHFDIKLEITELVEPTLLNELSSHMRRDKQRFFDKEGSIDRTQEITY